MNKIFAFLALAIFCFGGEKIVTDMSGNEVKIPAKVEKIAALWHANNQIILALGGMDKVVATTDGISKNKWFNRVYPRLKSIPALLNGNDVNLEELLKLNPDVSIVSNSAMLSALQKQGFVAVKATFSNYGEMQKSIFLTSQIIGESSKQKADELVAYLQKNIKIVSDKTADLKPSLRPKVLHIVDKSNLLKIDGIKTIIDEWINIGGGINALQKEGVMQEITSEEVAMIDPDVIIIGGEGGDEAVAKIYAHPAFSGTKAVKNKKVFNNPRGVFNWDRYGAEAALQILWTAKTLHPQLFADIDLKKETKAFYKNFMNYDLSDDEFGYILKGLGPNGE